MNIPMNVRLAVLVSGTGSLLEAMINDGLPIQLVLTDRYCRGVDIAENAKIDVITFPREAYGYIPHGTEFDREAFTRDFTGTMEEYGIELVAMAGFMTIFSPSIFDPYAGRILNSHPSLLPSFKGEHAVRDALAFGVKVTGTTIHIATTILDEGPILAQEAVNVLDGDTVGTLHERIKQVERQLYPRIIRSFATTLS